MVFESDEQKRGLIATIKAEDDPIKRLQLLGNLVKKASRDDNEVLEFLNSLISSDPSAAVQSFAKRCAAAFSVSPGGGVSSQQSAVSAPKTTTAPVAAPPAPVISDERMQRLVDLLGNDEASYRLKAVHAVAQVKLVLALPHLAKALKLESSSRVIEELLPTISQLDEKSEYFNEILPFLRNSDSEIRLAAVLALDKYDDKRKYRLLTTLADDEDEQVKSAVIKSFAHLSREELISELKSMGGAGNASMKLSVLSFLAHLSWPELSSLIVNLAADGDPEVRKKAIRILSEKGEPLFLELIAAWIPAAATEDLGMLLEALPTFDKASKGERSTDVQILKSRLQRIIGGDDTARNIDVVLSVLKTPEKVTVDTPGSTVAAEKYRTKKTPKSLKSKKPKKVEQDNELRKGRLGDQNILQKLNFITRIVYILKIAAVFSLFYLAFHHFNPLWDQYIQNAKELRIASDFKTMASAIVRAEAAGKKFRGKSSDDLVTQGLLQSCSDPWAQPYLLSIFYKSFKSLGADRSLPVTAPVLLTVKGKLSHSDDITDYYGTKKPETVWISVDSPGKPQLFEVSIDGAKGRDITNISSNQINNPSLSPDGLKLAWLKEVSSESGEVVYKVSIGDNIGNGSTAVSEQGTDFSAISWSIDSSRIIYSYKKLGGSGLSKMVVYDNSSGESKTYFSDMPDNDTNPSFSRKDGTIYFARRLGSDTPVLKCYRDGWVATKEPFDRTIYGDSPLVPSNGFLFFFKGDKGSEQLFRIKSRQSNEESWLEEHGIISPVKLSTDGLSIVFPTESDYGYVVKVLRIVRGKKGEVSYEKHSIFGTPWPILSITQQKSGSLSESSSDDEEDERNDSHADDSFDEENRTDSGSDDDEVTPEPSGSGTNDDDDIDI